MSGRGGAERGAGRPASETAQELAERLQELALVAMRLARSLGGEASTDPRETMAGSTRARVRVESDAPTRRGSSSSSSASETEEGPSPSASAEKLDATRDGRAPAGALKSAMDAAPRNYEEPSETELEIFKVAWTEMTGRRVTEKMVKPLARIWRVHGSQAPDVLRKRFSASGPNNLMIEMLREARTSDPGGTHVDESVGDLLEEPLDDFPTDTTERPDCSFDMGGPYS